MNRKWIRVLTLVVVLTAVSVVDVLACVFTFRLIDANGFERRLIPGSAVNLELNMQYALHLEFLEDHRNCAVPADQTLFMIDGARWRENRESQGLNLNSAIVWTEETRTRNTALADFTAVQSGIFTLELSRSCSKGGYNEKIIFTVP